MGLQTRENLRYRARRSQITSSQYNDYGRQIASERFAMPILVMCTSNNRNREHGRKAGDKFNLLRSFFNYAGTQPTSHVKTEDGQ